jgi:Clostridium P-47 protein
MMATDPGLLADTYGWDTAFAIRATDVNAAIVRAHSSPPNFSASTADPHTGKTVTVTGDFGDWQLTLGGSGKLVRFSTPVTSLVASGTSPSGQPESFTYGPGAFEIEVELTYIPHTDPPTDGSGTFHNLVVKTAAVAEEQVVTVLTGYGFGDSTDPAHLPFSEVADDVEAAMQEWFNENLADFEHVFATVNLNRDADHGQFAWLLPSYTSYAYSDGATLDDSVLGILCMTGGRTGQGLDQEISTNAIPAGSRGGFLIAPERFISEMLWPSMPLVYEGVQMTDFKMRTDATGLTLANGPVEIKSVTDDDGNAYETQLRNLEISTADQTLTVDATTRVEVSAGIHAFTHSIATFDLQLKDLSPTEQTIFYVQTDSVPPEHWTEESEGVKIAKIFEGIIAAVIVVVVGVLTDGAGFVIAAVVVGILAGVAAKVPDIIGAANTDASPSLSLLTFNAVDPLQWSDQQDFTLDQVCLNYSLQMGGTPHFGAADAAAGGTGAPASSTP